MSDGKGWLFAILNSLWICAVVLTLFYIWFAVANRYSIFLYAHLGAEPFDAVTCSRYWMAGLVACGVILVLNVALNLILGRLNAWDYLVYQPPKSLQIWLISALPLVLGILAITMTQNWPTLPLFLALTTAGATVAGLALALPTGPIAAQQPSRLLWLTLYGLALMPLLLVFHAVELPKHGILDENPALALSGLSLITTTLAVACLDLARKQSAHRSLRPINIVAAGFCVNYLILPLVHHLVATPPDHRYITTAGNFFAYSPVLQVTTWLLAILVIVCLDRIIYPKPLEPKESQ